MASESFEIVKGPSQRDFELSLIVRRKLVNDALIWARQKNDPDPPSEIPRYSVEFTDDQGNSYTVVILGTYHGRSTETEESCFWAVIHQINHECKYGIARLLVGSFNFKRRSGQARIVEYQKFYDALDTLTGISTISLPRP